jgi:stage II sporulation protein D
MSGSHSFPKALLALLMLLCFICAAPVAAAADRLTIRGAGFGHGVGMSQYGAYGMAQNGASYRDILSHYYTGTRVDDSGTGRTVRVLLQSLRGQATFTGATAAAGKKLNPGTAYRVRRGPAGMVDLLSPSGRRMKRVVAPLVVSGRPLVLKGRALNGRVDGAYRGKFEFRPGYVGVQAVNAVSLEHYIRGVVGDEMPPSWHPEALKAQAVAARTYAVTTSKAGNGFDQYPDTRSQVYGGIAAEEPTVDVAVAATRGELVTYQGRPVVTFFFSTSGGRTEDVENTPLGDAPLPWLKSVEDPQDKLSPRHRWGPIRMTFTRAKRRLGDLVLGEFRGIKVTRRGRSPRVVTAEVVGSRGRTSTTGAVLRARLGLFDTWAYFTSVSADEKEEQTDQEEPPRTDSTGGVSPTAMAARELGRQIAGLAFPARGDVLVERLEGGRWVRVGLAEVAGSGRYALALDQAGRYRVRFRGERGPVVKIR